MADPTPERTTSVAKEITIDTGKPGSLDNTPPVKPVFQQSSHGASPEPSTTPPQQERSTAVPQQGSQMIRQDRPHQKLTPQGPMREASDRQSYKTDLGNEHSRENKRIEAIRNTALKYYSDKQKAQPTIEQSKGKGKQRDKDDEMGM